MENTQTNKFKVFVGNLPFSISEAHLKEVFMEVGGFSEDQITEVIILKEKNPALFISTKVINYSPKHSILNEAESFGADLIMVGSHGGSGLTRFLLGSVSQAVALHADCSVEIVRNRDLREQII